MPSMISTAIQNTFIKAGANLTAQLAAQWTTKEPLPLDMLRIVEFAVFGFVGAHIGYMWHLSLERAFPTQVSVMMQQPIANEKDADKKVAQPSSAVPADEGQTLKVSYRNVVAKVVADQSVGLAMMVAVFLFITNIARVRSVYLVLAVIQDKLFGLVRAGWHIWPLVALCNFLWVPVRWRVLVSSCVGFGWNIFLSIVSMTGAKGA